jgi:hypothetical protein
LTAAFLGGSRAATADAVMAAIRGGESAKALIRSLQGGCAPIDALHDALAREQAAGEPERVRGFLRAVQKALERAA